MSDSGGFTTSRRIPADAERVYAAFVEPAKLEQWFVVDGFHTPADRMRVDARPGGRMEAVMVGDADGTEIPFGFEYAELEPPHRLVLRFDEPAEVVTLTIRDDGDAVELSYDFVRTPAPSAEEAAAAQVGADDMLGRIAAGVASGSI
jgi:uncharacterized protein YndB with AHSA1/START domain